MVNVNGKILPLLEYVTNDHSTPSIRDFGVFMKKYWEQNKISWPPFQKFVTDWASASVTGLMGAWNNLTVLEYSELVYNEVQNGIPLPSNMIRFFLLCPHNENDFKMVTFK